MESVARRVAVFMGGVTAEHDVSLASGRVVLDGLLGRHHILPVRISRDGFWEIPDSLIGIGSTSEQIQNPFALESTSRTDPSGALARLRDEQIEVVFLALHGSMGEDGAMQGFLEIAGIPYTGSGVGPSALAMDKIWTREMLAHHGIPVPACSISTLQDWSIDRASVLRSVSARHSYPVVAKSPCLGSSIGMGMPEDQDQLSLLLDELFEMDDRVLIESRIEGIELTCAVLETSSGMAQALPPTEILPGSGAFFDYDAKYTPGATQEITPARIDEQTTCLVQETALAVHRILRLGAVSRTDFILNRGIPVVLETNTLPGLTRTSLLPQGAAAAGIDLESLLDTLLDRAIGADHPAAHLPVRLSV